MIITVVLKNSKSITFAPKMHLWNITKRETKSKTGARFEPAIHRLLFYHSTDWDKWKGANYRTNKTY